MTERDAALDGFDPIAGAVCLDFANTVGGLRGHEAHDYLATYADLVRWGRREGVLTAEEADRLAREAATRPEEAGATLARAVALREAVYRLFAAIPRRADPAPEDLAALNAELGPALGHAFIARTPGGFAWRWATGGRALDPMLWRVARSAADLLLSPALGAVRQCASDTCGWLFIDATKNRSRRWCDMRGCGNRAKARRHRARQRTAPERPEQG